MSSNFNDVVQYEFELDPTLIYLNHAAVTPWPKRTRDAVSLFATENQSQGSLNYPAWLKVETELRKKVKKLINAPSANDIALVKNTSEGLSFIAYGIAWKPGDNVVITDQEFPFNNIVWQSLSSQGVELRIAKILSFEENHPEQSLFDLCDENTRLIAMSSIQYTTGLKMDLETVGNYCEENDLLFCLDAIQSIGATAFDVQQSKAHFVVADGHKWMLGPEGLGFFYCSSNIRDTLKLTQFGWHMVEDMGDYEAKSWEPARSARRFECGSPNMLGIHALNASLSLVHELGMNEIENANRKNTELMLQLVDASKNLELISPRGINRLGAIVTFKHRKHHSKDVYDQLLKKRIFCANRGGGIRFSPHFYTKPKLIHKAIETVDRC